MSLRKNRYIIVSIITLFLMFFSSCKVSNKTIQRQLKLEEGVSNPLTIEELQDAINKYSTRVSETQLAMSQVGMWYRLLGTRYVDNKMYGEALKCFQEAIKYYPNNQNLFYYVGVCAGYMSKASLDYGATGTHNQKYNYLKLAEEAYLRALEIDGRYTNAMYGLSVVYLYELEEPDKAIPLLEKLLSIDTRHFDAMFALARAYVDVYEYDKAIQMYDKIIDSTKSEELLSHAKENRLKLMGVSHDY